MKLAYHYLAGVFPKKEKWIIQARIIRLWIVPSFDDPTENFSIGGKIQATVKKSLISTFQLKLNEGNLYTISNLGVGQNKGEYKPTSHA
ncbi:RNA2 polyprotein [Bienertia sinuspersici]